MELFLFLGSLFLFLALGIPICVVLILCALVLMLHSGLWDPMMIASSMVDAADNYPLMAIPFFIFAGEIMTEGGLSYRVVQMAQLMIGHVRGGLGYAAIVASIIFAGLMGSSVAEAAAIGGLLLPMMKNVGYNPGRAGSVIASGAFEGLGMGLKSLKISLMRYAVIIIPIAFVLSRIIGPTGVWHAFWLAELITAVYAGASWKRTITVSL